LQIKLRAAGFPDFRHLRVFVAQISLISMIETLRSVSSEQSSIFYRFKEAVPQLTLTPEIIVLFGFKALFGLFHHSVLDCWTAS